MAKNWSDGLTKKYKSLYSQHKSVGSVLVLAVLIGFVAGLFYSHSGVTGLVVDDSVPPIADLIVTDAFFVKELDYQSVVGTRALSEVQVNELEPYRLYETLMGERLRIITVVKNRGSESLSERLLETGNRYNLCNIAGTATTTRSEQGYNKLDYINFNCADIGAGETKLFSGGMIDKLSSPGKFCLDVAVDLTNAVTEWAEDNNFKQGTGCMNVPVIYKRERP